MEENEDEKENGKVQAFANVGMGMIKDIEKNKKEIS